VRSYGDVDWDTFWRWEAFRRRRDPLDFMVWKADSSRELRALPEGRDRDGVPPRILDASCGMGYHAMVQHRLGFRVEACDRSEVALAAARSLMDEQGMAIPTFEASWEELDRLVPERYDLIFNDELHQVRPRDELVAVLRGFRGALRPFGSLVFFFADASKPDNGPPHARWDWENVHRDRLAWTARSHTDGLEVSLWILPELVDETLVLEHHVYLVRRDGEPARTESMVMARNYLWDWSHIVPVLAEAGFAAFSSRTFTNVEGRTYTMNLATRAG
jgi:SAM-dependent methyltransferase